jgi:molecular chaperone HscB
MQWREALDEARTAGDPAAVALHVSQVATEVAAQRTELLQRLARLLDDAGDYTAAAAEVRALMFLDKLIAECVRLGAPSAVDGCAHA